MIKNIWPASKSAGNLTGLLLSVVCYIVVAFLVSFVLGLASGLPVIGLVTGLLRWLVSAYCGLGIVASILVFLKVI